MELGLNENEIIRLYIDENLNISQIAKKFNVAHNTIKIRLVRNNIKLRSFIDIQKQAMNRVDVKEKISRASRISNKRRQETNLKRYGHIVPANNKRLKEEWLTNVNWDKRNKKSQQTCLHKYNVNNASKTDDVKKKIKENRWDSKSADELNRIREKTKNTCLENFNADNPLKNNEIKEKVRKARWVNKSKEELKKINDKAQRKFNQGNKEKALLKLEKYNIELLEEYKGCINSIKVKCKKCNHIFETVLDYIFHDYGRCPKCYPINISSSEKELVNFISSKVNDVLICNSRNIIRPYELDIYIPSKNIAIEFNGIYYHSEKFYVNKNYHLEKTLRCEEKEIRLIHIFEDEWIFKKDIVKSRILNALQIKESQRIHARKCEIKVIEASLKNKFLDKYHIQGKDYFSSINLGSFYDNELVSVMTFSKGNISKGSKPKEGIWELNRFCSNYNYHIPGIASKLLKHFQRNFKWKEIFSYADRRWSNGNLYEKLGFDLIHITKPNYWYIKNYKRIHRFNLRKRKDEPKHTTERELRMNEGYYRIWDCGNYKFVMKNYNNS